MTRDWLISAVLWLQLLDQGEQLGLIETDQLVDDVVEGKRLGKVEEVLVAPGSSEVAGDLFDGLVAAGVAECSETTGVAFSGDDRADNRHASLTGEISHGSMHLHVHLVEIFLHPLHKLGALCDEVRHLTLQGP